MKQGGPGGFKLRVLLTNDDGIEAEGLKVLEAALKEAGAEVVVVAPDQERSGASHSVSLRRPLQIYERGPDRYAISGTPADAAHLAVNHILKDRRPDLLVSGINLGANLGCDIHYSGTAAAAREGALLGVPSFAISLDTRRTDADFRPAARFGVDVAKELARSSLPERTFLNINLPDLPEDKIKGVRATVQGIRHYDNIVNVQHDGNGDKHFTFGGAPLGGANIEESDIIAVKQGLISVTPLRLDLTQKDAMPWLSAILDGKGRGHGNK
jgi:5'-nucleotidase